MNVRRPISCFVLASVMAMLLAPAPATAGTIAWISYAAKFVCGAQAIADDIVVTGKYRTIVNIHNPHNLTDFIRGGFPIPVVFFKKVVLAKPQDEPRLPPSCHQQEFLEADGALGVDCDNIKTLLSLSGLPTTGDLEGYLVIEVPPFQSIEQSAPPPLDVTALYTARKRTGTNPDSKIYDVESIDVERVPSMNIIGTPVQNLCPPAP